MGVTDERCGICEAGNRDLGVLIGSRSVTPSQMTDEKVRNAYARLSAWITHVRTLPNARAHVDALKLANLSGTAYVGNVLQALGNPKLEDASIVAMSRARQDEMIASALVLLISGAHIWPLGVHREATERIARSWGWSG